MRVILSLLALISTPLLAVSSPKFREDLRRGSAHFCEESSASLRAKDIYDVQLELAFVKNVKDPDSFAKEFASENKHRGYSYGNCKDQRQWIISSPARNAIVILKDKSITLDMESLNEVCASYDVDAIQKSIVAPVSLVKEKAPSLKPTEDLPLDINLYSTLAVSCHPKDKAKEGNELWSLIPLSPPEKIAKIRDEAAFLRWIVDVRERNQLGHLSTGDKALQDVANESAVVKDLKHPREMLLRKKSELEESGMELLGENRATAASYKGLAEILWNSPSHRRLLLNPKANRIAIKTTAKGDEKLLVMVLARK